MVLGAQRDAWGRGYTKAAVGTSVLVELAKAVRQMVERGNKYVRFHIFLTDRGDGEVCISHTPPPCVIRWIQAQEEYHVCQLECWRVWKRWRHRVVGGQLCISVDSCVKRCCSANALLVFQGYMSSISQKVFTYISLDGVVMGQYHSSLYGCT